MAMNQTFDLKVPISTILHAIEGDEIALQTILMFYRPYMKTIASNPTYDVYGVATITVDEELMSRLETKLLLSVLRFKVRECP